MSTFSSERLTRLLDALGRIAGGNLDERIPLSSAHDELDAIGHAINVLVGELQIVASGLRRAKEDAEAASMAKTIFLRNVSHEIRTPLTVVLGMSDLIASRSVPKARVEELRERIAANGRALVTILDDLLDLAKIESTRINFELEPVQVSHLAGEVVESFEALAARKQVALVFESTGADDAHVLADPKRLRQILMNLIGNAVKFTEHGQIAVRVTESPGTRQVFVDIADTGIGMTPEQAHEVFEPFAQADATIARRYGGSGLGLAISKRFAQGMGGGLDVAATEPGRGTTFRLTLPATATATAAPPITSSTAREVAPLSALRVLVVEDHEDVRATTTELLTRAGAVVSEAVDGQDAIDAVQGGAFDAILMDIRMPRLDGIEATRRLRASGQTMPIIALTADAVPEQQAECLAAGCNGYLAKPLDLDQLVTLLGDAAAAHREAP
jgi:signal transduction histidine kinase/ActR/RegA family two-component response regulator